MITREEIEERIYDWVYENIGRDFEFRPYQFEKIADIIENILITKENHTHVIEAPTGSGKSLIIIISAGVLSKYYSMSSYILCSDLFLFDQYAKFLEDNPRINFGMIKGQSGNYKCLVNDQDARNGDCKLAQISWPSLFNYQKALELGYPCAKDCEYVKARKKALNSKVVLMTYQLFLFTMYWAKRTNSQNDSHFKQKDIVFCDECHNIPDIVQNKFSPSLQPKDIEDFMDIYHQSEMHSYELFDNEGYTIHKQYTEDEFRKKLEKIYDELVDETKSKMEDYNMVMEFIGFLGEIEITLSSLENYIGETKRKGKMISKYDIELHKKINHIRSLFGYWSDLASALDTLDSPYEYLIKHIELTKDDEKKVVLNCTKEDWMIYNYLLCEANWKVFLSATVGGKEAFEENIGAKFTKEKCIKFDSVPSTFDFSRSPVYFLNKYKMSYKEKETSFEALKPIIYNIIRKHKGQRGMIQTGSYDFAKRLMFYAPSDISARLLNYNGSREKRDMVQMHEMMEDTVLIGPTLAEGIDLPDDLCRFIIILKVPYPNLKDKLVNEKIKLFPLWYGSKTSNTIIQGIGRGVRNKNDYCTTYILDACFYKLYLDTKPQYSKELQERILIYN